MGVVGAGLARSLTGGASGTRAITFILGSDNADQLEVDGRIA